MGYSHRTNGTRPQDGCNPNVGVSRCPLAAQSSHRKIAVTTLASSGLAVIPLQKSQGFLLRWPQKNREIASAFWGYPQKSGVNKSARERRGRQNLSQKVPSKKGSLGVIFSPRNYRENAHSKFANFEGRRSGGHMLGRPLLLTSEKTQEARSDHGRPSFGPTPKIY